MVITYVVVEISQKAQKMNFVTNAEKSMDTHMNTNSNHWLVSNKDNWKRLSFLLSGDQATVQKRIDPDSNDML